jgi:tRNA(Ile)-lysidine synthetase-like protein
VISLNPLAAYENQSWVIMVSGGPDSMALLEYCRQASVRPFVLHVNYHARPTAMRDQMIVEDYCRKYEIYYCLEDGLFPGKSNFQAWAREFRYKCAAELAKRFDCEGIFTAHHRDDVLETYEMQTRARKSVGYYGIRPEGKMLGIRIVRPLLEMSKNELIKLCNDEDILFGIDESNVKPDYLRNRIRLELQNQSDEEKSRMLVEIKQKNEIIQVNEEATASLIQKAELSVEALDDNRQLLRNWLSRHSARQRFASTFLDEILRQIQREETFEIVLNQSENLLVQYRKLRIVNQTEDFKIIFDSIEYRNYSVFEFREKGETREAVEFFPDDFPITIRNLQANDAIKLTFGTKNILRWCVDRKIPLDARRKILVIENKTGEILFASGIGANVTHTCAHPRVFVVK